MPLPLINDMALTIELIGSVARSKRAEAKVCIMVRTENVKAALQFFSLMFASTLVSCNYISNICQFKVETVSPGLVLDSKICGDGT